MNKKDLPLTHVLGWIIASLLFVSCPSYGLFKHYLKKRRHLDPAHAINSIVQTGPQREALKTEYLAELIGLASDRLCSVDLTKAKQRLLRSPLISRAELKVLGPSTLYVDYTVRQPIAWLEDYSNVAIDKDGYPFPFSPFFSPKNLPAIYFGLTAFAMPPVDTARPYVQWGTPMVGKYVELAFDVLAMVSDPKVSDLFSVKRIDVSNAFAESYGTREVVLITEDVWNHGGVTFTFPRILRLSTKNYAQELGNYLKLRGQLLDEERKSLKVPEGAGTAVRLKAKIIDFRIQKLAFIDEQQSTRL
jgi:cell division septal protein FtsQ